VSFIETELILFEIKVLALRFPASTFLAWFLSRVLRSAISAFTRVFDALWACERCYVSISS
jgi:hypothetical protein